MDATVAKKKVKKERHPIDEMRDEELYQPGAMWEEISASDAGMAIMRQREWNRRLTREQKKRRSEKQIERNRRRRDRMRLAESDVPESCAESHETPADILDASSRVDMPHYRGPGTEDR